MTATGFVATHCLSPDEARCTTGAALDVDGGCAMDGSPPGKRYQ
jgi:hypothetical protein